MPPYHKQSSRNHQALVQFPHINPSPTFLAPSFQNYQADFANDLFPVDLGANNNQPIDIHEIAAADAAAAAALQAITNALQTLEAQELVSVDTSLIENHHHRNRRHDFFFSRLILSIAVYLCPTFIVKPMTPLRFRMTVPIILHLVFAFAVLVLVALTIVGSMSPIFLLSRS
ncbi:hypothetical protein K457DRAFT_130503 [Linnemannia elongata AG-77]|uniref:Uncharacterized protein n=1 Tax=Linnemannia elongata AG-77 TaxID=1314771 RepID=A0A197JEL6_9FUNG|nr:hypothetical protein K457DRAFT_130503 [Linnemannia elongata AG-77]